MFSLFLLVYNTRAFYVGIDVGSYYTKASTVTSNEHPTIATNYETKRMTPTFLAFRPPPTFDINNKSYVSPAEAKILTPEFGQNAYNLLQNRPWLGTGFLPYFIDINETDATKVAQSFFLNLTASRVPYDDCVPLFYKKFITAIAKGRPVKGVNLVVPTFFTIPQRNQLKRMIRLSRAFKYNVRIIDDAEAMAYVYSNEKSSKFKTDPRIVLFIDVGATSIKSYAIMFSLTPDNQVHADRLSYEYDAENGGAFLSAKIVNYISQKLDLNEPSDAERWRMFDAAEKLKKQLTLTEDATVSIENLGGKDRSFTLTRDELEILSSDLLKSLVNVVQKASFNLTIDEYEIIGGSSRLTSIPKTLSNIKLSRTLNTDETLAIGAGYFNQFIKEVSKYPPVVIEDYASVYDITLFTINGSGPVCRKGIRCLARKRIDGNGRYALFVYDDESLRKGISTKSFGYSIKPQEDEVELAFTHMPFDLHSARLCNGTVCQKNVNIEPMETVKPVSSILKAIVQGEKARRLMANAHNKLELLVQKVEHEIEFNESVINFSSQIQRQELKNTIEQAKKWIFEEAHLATDSKNFSKFSDRINKLTLPIYKRISESRSLKKQHKLFIETLGITKYAIEKDWPEKGTVPPEKYLAFYLLFNETQDWYLNATESNSKTPTSEFPPFKSKEFEKKGRHLYDEFLKIEKIANPPTQSPAPTSSPEPTLASIPSPVSTPESTPVPTLKPIATPEPEKPKSKFFDYFRKMGKKIDDEL
ncbi:hypothetical protein TRFO_01936 [Tritrichomonas foetus]|uniref:DnaK protein n=1 Tax=Tritrichomonas foetus TaxID=1144522 RepID=A0A1J4JNL2_9EUKA|nr:hypothetical protein TRFO_01936 [Tritrichomonas foetus]|eukprot:OHS98852.1 hypothetical protein TRFO_01936 [Tritrichomonas foetus]